MTAFDWVAIVGAAAWLPQIGALVYRRVIAPKLHFLPVARGELTFNSLGPIFNVRAAVVVERKDAVITQMGVELRHERGRLIELEWDSYVEQMSELRTQGGERNEWSRDQQATALKVSPALPTEKFFRFQDPAFKTAYRRLAGRAFDSLSRLPDRDEVNMGGFFRSQEYTELLRLYTTGFPWEPGRYEVQIVVRILGDRRKYRGSTALTLSSADIEYIRQNGPLIEGRLEGLSRNLPPAQLQDPSRWAEPYLEDRAIELKRSASDVKEPTKLSGRYHDPSDVKTSPVE